jgi:hypothetical protein
MSIAHVDGVAPTVKGIYAMSEPRRTLYTIHRYPDGSMMVTTWHATAHPDISPLRLNTRRVDSLEAAHALIPEDAVELDVHPADDDSIIECWF